MDAACPPSQNALSLQELLEISISSEELGTINFNALRLLLSGMIHKLDKLDASPVRLRDMDARQLANYKSYMQGERSSPMAGVMRVPTETDQLGATMSTPPGQQMQPLNYGAPGQFDQSFLQQSQEGEDVENRELPLELPCKSKIQQLLEDYGTPQYEFEAKAPPGMPLPGQLIQPQQLTMPQQLPPGGQTRYGFDFDYDFNLDFGQQPPQQGRVMQTLQGQLQTPSQQKSADNECPECDDRKRRSCHCFDGGFDNDRQPSSQQSLQSKSILKMQSTEKNGQPEPPPAKSRPQTQPTVSSPTPTEQHKLPPNNNETTAQQQKQPMQALIAAQQAVADPLQQPKGEDGEDQELQDDENDSKEDIQTLFNNLANVIAECADQKERIDQLVDTVRIIESGMVNKQFLMDMISDKADKGQINTKVSYDEFGKTVEELHAQLHNLMVEGYQRNENWKKVTADLAEDLSEKLDKIELAPIRAFFKGRLKKLEDRVLSLAAVLEEPDPAGTRKLLKNYNCLSCDRRTNISGCTNAGVLPSLGGATAMPSTASHRTYDLHRLRTQRTQFDAEAKQLAELERQMKSQTGRKGSCTGRSDSQLGDKDMMQIVNRYVGSNPEMQGKKSSQQMPSQSQRTMAQVPAQGQGLSTVTVTTMAAPPEKASRLSADYGQEE